MHSEKKFHNPAAVAARLRSGAGKHRETRIEMPCCWCGADTGSPRLVFCSEKCDYECNDGSQEYFGTPNKEE